MNANQERLHPGQVSWLLLALTLVMLPHTERLPWWITLLSALLLAWRAYITWHSLHMPSKWLLFTIAGGAIGGIYLHYGRLLGRDSGVALLVVMLVLKLLDRLSIQATTARLSLPVPQRRRVTDAIAALDAGIVCVVSAHFGAALEHAAGRPLRHHWLVG